MGRRSPPTASSTVGCGSGPLGNPDDDDIEITLTHLAENRVADVTIHIDIDDTQSTPRDATIAEDSDVTELPFHEDSRTLDDWDGYEGASTGNHEVGVSVLDADSNTYIPTKLTRALKAYVRYRAFATSEAAEEVQASVIDKAEWERLKEEAATAATEELLTSDPEMLQQVKPDIHFGANYG